MGKELINNLTIYTNKWEKSHPEEVKAGEVLRAAVKAGKIKKESCEICGDKRTGVIMMIIQYLYKSGGCVQSAIKNFIRRNKK